MSDPGLEALLTERAALLEGTMAARLPGGSLELSMDGRPYAVVKGGAATFHLRPAVARAALRTPDVTPAAIGYDWVAFAPAELDGFARDRAVAWLESAWRLADEDATAASADASLGADESNAPPGARRGD